MDDIPQDVLFEAYSDGQMATTWDFLRLVAQHHTDRAERERALRKKSWQSRSRELDGVADHIRSYADQLETFAANNPTGASLVADDDNREDPRDTVNGETDQPQPKGKKAKPQLPGNTGRCASFRRANPDDQTVCGLERGHEGEHIGVISDGDEVAWPRTPSGHVCGDVVILHDGTALNCQRPLGHDGDEHHDGRYQFWPRGVGTSRQVRVCDACNSDVHVCPGCGEPIGHYAGDCGKNCTGGPAPVMPADIFPGQCTSLSADERCMLPGTHTGKHKGTAGHAWDRAAEPVAVIRQDDPHFVTKAVIALAEPGTLGDIAEQQRAAMVIPEQRPESDPVPQLAGPEFVAAAQAAIASTPVPAFTTRESDGAAVYNGALAAPEMAHVAQMKEEVSAIVDGFVGNPFLTAGGNVPEGASLLGNPFQAAPPVYMNSDSAVTTEPGPDAITATLGNPFQAPAPPPAAFLPPHLVPGAPKAHQSHSSITTMEKCGLQYRLKYRDGFGDDTPAWWNVAGTVFHTVVQEIEAAHADGTPLWATDGPLMEQERAAAGMWREGFASYVANVERETGKARSTWKAAKGGKEGEAFWREYGGDLARMYVGHRRKFLAEPEGWRLLTKPGGGWAHEVEFNATVDGVLLKGFIDAAWISADATTILIEDLKSGASEGDPFQPKLYGAALRALGFTDGRRVITRFYEARKGAHSETVELTPADDAEVSYRANTAAMMDRAGIFPPNPSGYNCSTCPVRSRCPIMATKS